MRIEKAVFDITAMMDLAAADRTLSRSDYRDVLQQVVAEAKARLDALDADDAAEEE